MCGAECPSKKDVCPPTWSLTKAGCYKVVPGDSQESRLTKEAARAACEEAGGYLAEVTSREEQEQLATLLDVKIFLRPPVPIGEPQTLLVDPK